MHLGVVGVDKGTTNTKNSYGKIFRSTYRRDDSILGNTLTIEYEGNRWIVGEEGNYNTDLLKAEQQMTKPFILLSLGLCSEDNYITADVVAGLPIGVYKNNKAKMKSLLENTVSAIVINGKSKLIRIDKVEIFPEAAGAFYSQNFYSDALVVDIGGWSIDTALFEDKKLKKFSTYSIGIMKLYRKIGNYITNTYDAHLSEWEIQKVLEEGLYIYGQKVDDSEIERIILEHVGEIERNLRIEYDNLKAIRHVLFCGGGALSLAGYFNVPHWEIIRNSLFANAIGYKNIGEALWQ